MTPIAFFHSPLTSKFGIPRQSGLTKVEGRIVFEPQYRNADALRGLEGFDYLWLIWEFSANRDAKKSPTVRPPLLGGNERVGVWATRSPFRPNNLGLSSVRIVGIDLDTPDGPVISVEGADLMDGTPIFDIKPYVTYADCHPDARSGFVDERAWPELEVVVPDGVKARFSPSELEALTRVLALDPRPQYHDDSTRVYGMPFGGHDIHFRVEGRRLLVLDDGRDTSSRHFH